MITKKNQSWAVGATVKVGFLTMIVKAVVATPGDYAPDAYILANQTSTQIYKFVPHNGLTKIDADEAREMLEAANRYATKLATKAIANAAASREIDALFA